MATQQRQVTGSGLTGPSARLRRIVLNLQYQNAASGYLVSQWIVLDADNPDYTWCFSDEGNASGHVFYHGDFELVNGSIQPIPVTLAVGNDITVGLDGLETTVVVLPTLLAKSWNELGKVAVALTATGGDQPENVTFTSVDSPPGFWNLPEGGNGVFDWTAAYTLKDDRTGAVAAKGVKAPFVLAPGLPPSWEVSVSVRAADFATLPIKSIAVHLTSGFGIASTYTFNEENADQAWISTQFEQLTPDAGFTKAYAYHYTVAYTDPALQAFTSPEYKDVTDTDLRITDIGIIKFDAAAITFDLIRSVLVKDSTKKTLLTLDGSTAAGYLTSGKDYQSGAPFDYLLDFTVQQIGNYMPRGVVTDNPYVSVENPFVPKEVKIVSVGITDGKKDIKQIQLQLASEESGPGWKLQSQASGLVLNAQTPSKSWAFTAAHPDSAAVVYRGTVFPVKGGTKPIEPTATTASIIKVGDVPPWFSVKIIPELIQWQDYSKVECTVSPSANTTDAEAYCVTFEADSSPAYWGFERMQPPAAYNWEATYFDPNGTKAGSRSGSRDPNSLLMLPAKAKP